MFVKIQCSDLLMNSLIHSISRANEFIFRFEKKKTNQIFFRYLLTKMCPRMVSKMVSKMDFHFNLKHFA